jgi:leader peptidase (prepilin peptidase)/N-methyltransferase
MSGEVPIQRSDDPESVRERYVPVDQLWSSVRVEGEQLGPATTDCATVGQLTSGRRETSSTRAIRSATAPWAGSSSFAKCAAILTLVALVTSTIVLDIPVASAIALIVLIPAMLVDLRERRIPNRWVLAAAASLTITLSMSVALGNSVAGVDIIVGALVMSLPILLLHLLSPASMGFGDVKAAFVLGAALGIVNWQLALVGLALAAGIGATVGIVSRARTIAFGPYLLIGATIALSANLVLLDAALVGGGR